MNEVLVGLDPTMLAKLDTLATKMGVTVETIFPWFVNHCQVTSICNALGTMAIFFISLFAFYMCYPRSDWDRGDKFAFFSVVSGCFLFVSTLFIWFGTGPCISTILFPQQAATQALLQLLK